MTDIAQMKEKMLRYFRFAKAWLLREEHQQKAREFKAQAHKAFTEHPEEAGETYLQHLWFTTTMSARFLYASLVIMIHGAFPFLLTTAASTQIETVYRIMKSRIPAARRETLDAGDGI